MENLITISGQEASPALRLASQSVQRVLNQARTAVWGFPRPVGWRINKA